MSPLVATFSTYVESAVDKVLFLLLGCGRHLDFKQMLLGLAALTFRDYIRKEVRSLHSL